LYISTPIRQISPLLGSFEPGRFFLFFLDLHHFDNHLPRISSQPSETFQSYLSFFLLTQAYTQSFFTCIHPFLIFPLAWRSRGKVRTLTTFNNLPRQRDRISDALHVMVFPPPPVFPAEVSLFPRPGFFCFGKLSFQSLGFFFLS